MPRTLETDDLMTVFVEDNFTRCGPLPVLQDDEEEGAGGDGERVPLGGGILPSFDESS